MARSSRNIESPSERYFNRELSWLEFNQRVLEEAQDPANPLLERLKFFCIVSSNLDEFFEVRVAGLKQEIEGGVTGRTMDGLTPREALRRVTRRVRRMVEEQYRCWRDKLVPMLAERGVRFLAMSSLGAGDLAWVAGHYATQVRPVLTPLAIDPAHPFPQLLNKSLNIIVQIESEQAGQTLKQMAVVQVPRVLPRLVRLPREGAARDYVFLGQLIGHFLSDLFPGTRILGHWIFRVTRNSELYIDEEESPDLLKAVEEELHNRRKGDAVRLEVEKDCPLEIRQALLGTLRLEEDDLYVIDGPLNPTRLMTIYDEERAPELRDPPFLAPMPDALADGDVFEAIRERDLLLHHPFDSFHAVVRFLEQAARDPRVLAIKQTLYRTGGDSPVVAALMEAVRNGKQVTVVVELRARFDEANNILWARRLEEAGVHVVYGLVGYKIHAKLCLVVRRDDDGIRRYVHLGTGNYNPATARLYTDLGLLTCRPDFGEDVTSLFNLLTGICQFQGARKLIVAPFQMHDRIIALIRRETANAAQGLPAGIIAKMNSLVDPEVIDALYEASRAGVRIDLIVRGICCLRPGVRGQSENITVRSIVDRFLEHSRIFVFDNGCRPEVYVGSADWMPRNFFRRIETLFPVEDGQLRDRLLNDILATYLADTARARLLQPDGRYVRVPVRRGALARRSQAEFMRRATHPADRAAADASPVERRYAKVQLRPNPFARPRPV